MREKITNHAIIKLGKKLTFRKEKTPWKKILLLAILISGLLGWSQVLEAQEYPTRPINLLISFPPGAGCDGLARKLADGATKILGQEIVPMNKPGGGGSLAVGILTKSKNDGYTLAATVSNMLTAIPHMQEVPYDPLKDVIPIIQYGFVYFVIAARSDSPFNTLKDVIDFARRNPGKVSCVIPGVGPNYPVEYLIREEEVNIALVPIRGGGPSMVSLLGGHVTIGSFGQGTSMQHLKAGKIKLLASTANKRIKDIPDVPTLLELGYPDSDYMDLYLIAAPKGTPSYIVEKLERTFRRVMEGQEYQNLAEDVYHTNVKEPLSLQSLKDKVEKDYARNGELIRKLKEGK